MAPIQGPWQVRRTPLGYLETEGQRAAPETEPALEILKKVLPAPDYHRMESEWRSGRREIRLEGGFIIRSLTPVL